MNKDLITDYSKSENWFVNQSNGNKKVDFIYFMPTTTKTDFKGEIYPIDQFVKDKSFINLNKIEPIFKDSCNIFMPLTRQTSHSMCLELMPQHNYYQIMNESVVKDDAYAALDYYFKHYNNNKPFILGGLCQGGIVVKIILSEYMKLHPQYYDRMIAAYVPGTCINKKYLKDNPHLKVAKSELDTNVIISWNTEGPSSTKPNPFLFDNPICINPLNWKTDDTYADISKNIGSLDWKNKKIIEPVANARIDYTRHCLITTTVQAKGYKPIWYEKLDEIGYESYHLYEWDFYAGNIKENVKKRIEVWFKNH